MGTSWVTPTTTMIRTLIDDLDSPYTYSDERLQTLATTAAMVVSREALLNAAYTITLSTSDITPDPGDTPDNAFLTLIAYKTACIILNSEYRTASNKAVSIKDGPSTIDGKGIAEAKKMLAKSVCDAYEDLKAQESANSSYTVPHAIVGPFNCDCTYGERTNRDGV